MYDEAGSIYGDAKASDVRIGKTFTSTHYSTGAFYDAQKKFISGFGNPNNNNNITVTSDGYARFSFDSKKRKVAN